MDKSILASKSLIVLLLALVGAQFACSSEKEPESEPVVEIEDPHGVLYGAFVALDPFVINLRGYNYLKLGITIEFFDFEQPNAQNLIPKIRDTIIEVISRKTPKKLDGVRDKNMLRQELLELLNEDEEQGYEIINIYFTEFTLL